MTTPLPIGFDPEALVLIVLGPVPFMVAVSGLRREAIIEAYRRVGLQIEIVEERRAASLCCIPVIRRGFAGYAHRHVRLACRAWRRVPAHLADSAPACPGSPSRSAYRDSWPSAPRSAPDAVYGPPVPFTCLSGQDLRQMPRQPADLYRMHSRVAFLVRPACPPSVSGALSPIWERFHVGRMAYSSEPCGSSSPDAASTTWGGSLPTCRWRRA